MINRRRLAAWLWVIWAVVVWNVVFDRTIVVAGRDYLKTARAAARAGAPYALIEDTMRPARSRAMWLATASAGLILVVAVALFRPTSSARPRRT